MASVDCNYQKYFCFLVLFKFCPAKGVEQHLRKARLE